MKKDQGPDKHLRGRASGIDPQQGQKPVWTPKRGGARQIGALVPGITKPAFKKKSPLLVRLSMDWEDFIGPRLSKVTEPRRMSAGTLTLACSGPVAMELQHLAPQIIERINTACGLRGEHLILRLKIVQDMTAFERPRPARPKPVQIDVPEIEDDELRDALQRLGGHIGARRGRRR
ncbi:hypothetical protein BAR24_03820 [Gluconobacter oxydans]|uniref:DUF721 domain-containing protein n=1 Tax=Gluconobacter thailandicus TaxID=257438 RepID=UPI00029971AC|nr:DciA family protein [Gluconobacter thailandicus]AFW00629.1 hypothetical protein B932_1042 [Gluconobacter oxydans H24]ANQ40672.1 hypothetical protein BAR24_03820 [Gluconobacter oxydans]GAN89596.1 hypothetical protein Gbfr_007_053 [Gluconobacter frateurii M-2]